MLSLAGTLLENVLRNRHRGESVWPTGVKGEMRNDFCGLRLTQAVIHRPVEVVRNLRDLTGSNQCADRDQAPVARRKVRTEPKVTKQNVSGVLDNSWKSRSELLFARCASAASFRGRGAGEAAGS